MKTWGKIFKKQINAETSRQDTYRLVANVNADIEDKPKLVLEIEDTGIARTKLVPSKAGSNLSQKTEKTLQEDSNEEISLHQGIIGGIFFFATFYLMAVVKLSIDIPVKFKSFDNDDDLDLTDKINQIVSPEGLWTWNLIPIIIFLFLGALVYSFEDAKNAEYLKKIWLKTVAISVTILAILSTIFSVWG